MIAQHLEHVHIYSDCKQTQSKYWIWRVTKRLIKWVKSISIFVCGCRRNPGKKLNETIEIKNQRFRWSKTKHERTRERREAERNRSVFFGISRLISIVHREWHTILRTKIKKWWITATVIPNIETCIQIRLE